uniref:Uncharacterized protein n=1 Tax=Steinernema glaseri TaxID=37863 RepID=A0A1I7YET4_9BILA
MPLAGLHTGHEQVRGMRLARLHLGTGALPDLLARGEGEERGDEEESPGEHLGVVDPVTALLFMRDSEKGDSLSNGRSRSASFGERWNANQKSEHGVQSASGRSCLGYYHEQTDGLWESVNPLNGGCLILST